MYAYASAFVSARRRRGNKSVPLTASAYITSAQACEDGSVAEGGQKVFERQSDITTRVARSTSYLGHTPVGWQVTRAEQPVSVL
jgi:hypothetical protein